MIRMNSCSLTTDDKNEVHEKLQKKKKGLRICDYMNPLEIKFCTKLEIIER